MNRLYKYITLVVLLIVATGVYAGDKLLVAGSGWNKIAIIDKDTKTIEWSYNVENECNNLIMTKAGNIAFAYKSGAALINKAGTVIWDYKAKAGEELFSIAELKNGNIMLAMCGLPARIVEISKTGEPIHEIKFDTGIKGVHGQLRQVKPTKRGTYIVPLLDGNIHEIDREGKIIRSVKVAANAYSVIELPNGNWLVSGGDASNIIEVNPKTSDIVSVVEKNDIQGVSLAFVAELAKYKNGNILISNWLGHSRDKTQPILLEIDSNNKEVWRLEKDINNIGAISAVVPLQGKFYR